MKVRGWLQDAPIVWQARSVDVALLEGALAGLGALCAGVVLAQLRVAVGLCALYQALLSCLLVGWLALQSSSQTNIIALGKLSFYRSMLQDKQHLVNQR